MMSANNKQSESAERAQWYLRVGENTNYGPVTLPVLVDWARQGRIAPGNHVSRDRRKWIAVEQMPELEMRWMVGDPSGRESGPYHRDAIEAMIRDGRLPSNTTLTDIGASSAAPDESETSAESETKPPPPPPASGGRKPKTGGQTAEASEPVAASPAGDGSGGGNAVQTEIMPVEDSAALRDTLKRERARLETQRREQAAERKRSDQRIEELQEMVKKIERERDKAIRQADEASELKKLNKELRDQVETMRAEFEAQRAEWMASEADAAEAETGPTSMRELTESLEKERLEHARTLQFANDRDVEAKAEIEKLQQRVNALETSVAGSDAADEAPGIPDPLLNLLRHWLSEDRDMAARLRDQAALRQDALQSLLREFSRLPGAQKTAPPESHGASDRQLADLRQEHIKATAEAQARERELLRRVRVVESQEIRLREELRTVENSDANSRALRDRLQQSERNLELATRQHETDREQWRSVEVALSNRIEELERAAGTLAGLNGKTDEPRAVIPPPDRKQRQPEKPRRGFQPTPWMRLK